MQSVFYNIDKYHIAEYNMYSVIYYKYSFEGLMPESAVNTNLNGIRHFKYQVESLKLFVKWNILPEILLEQVVLSFVFNN